MDWRARRRRAPSTTSATALRRRPRQRRTAATTITMRKRRNYRSVCLSASLLLSFSLFLCPFLFVCLSVSLSLVPFCLSVSLSLYLSVSLSLCLSVSLSLCLSVSLPLCLSASLSLCLSVSLSLCISVSLSLCLSVSLNFFMVFNSFNHLSVLFSSFSLLGFPLFFLLLNNIFLRTNSLPFQQQQQHQTPFLLLDCGCCSGKLVTGNNRRFLLNEYPPDGSQVRLKLLIIFTFFAFGTLSSICITNWFQKGDPLSLSLFFCLCLSFFCWLWSWSSLVMKLDFISQPSFDFGPPSHWGITAHAKVAVRLEHSTISFLFHAFDPNEFCTKKYVVESSVEIRGKATFYNKNSLLSGGAEPKASQSWVLCLNH